MVETADVAGHVVERNCTVHVGMPLGFVAEQCGSAYMPKVYEVASLRGPLDTNQFCRPNEYFRLLALGQAAGLEPPQGLSCDGIDSNCGQ